MYSPDFTPPRQIQSLPILPVRRCAMDLLKKSEKSRRARAKRAGRSDHGDAFVGCVPRRLDTDDSTVSGPTFVGDPSQSLRRRRREPGHVSLAVRELGWQLRPRGGSSWFYCTARKPAAELGPVSRECFDSAGKKLTEIGKSFEAKGTMPIDASCLVRSQSTQARG